MQTPKLSTLEKVGFGAGDMALNVVISSMMLIITYFYTDIYGLKTGDLALLFVLVKVVGALSDLVVGQMTDSFLTRWGRYRPYLLLLAVPYGVSVFMVFSTPDWGYDAKVVWAYSTYILMTLMTSGVGVPYISLISGLTADPQERLSANGYRLFLAKVGAFMVTIVVPILADHWGSGSRGRRLPGRDGADGRPRRGAVPAVLLHNQRAGGLPQRAPALKEQIRVLAQNDQWLILCAVCVTGTIGYVIRGSVAIYYAKYYLHGDTGTVSAFLSTGVAAAILAMVISTWVTKFYCKVKLFRYTQLLVAVLSVMIYVLVKPGDVALAFVLYFAVVAGGRPARAGVLVGHRRDHRLRPGQDRQARLRLRLRRHLGGAEGRDGDRGRDGGRAARLLPVPAEPGTGRAGAAGDRADADGDTGLLPLPDGGADVQVPDQRQVLLDGKGRLACEWRSRQLIQRRPCEGRGPSCWRIGCTKNLGSCLRRNDV
jgi:GPH family glycoside/pentoside/hexuronide:cation symporter